MIDNAESALLLIAILLVALGVVGILGARYNLLEKADRSKPLKVLLFPYRILDIRWIGKGRSRALGQIGWMMLALGLALVVGLLR